MSRVLITGGCGYLGTNLALALGPNRAILYDIRFHPECKGFTFVEGDICDTEKLAEAMKEHQVEAVLHAAGIGFIGKTNLPASNGLTRSVNLDGTISVLEACKMAGVKALVMTSTVNCAFYGRPIHNGTEVAEPVDLCLYMDEYSRSKRQAEDLVLAANQNNFRTCALRIGGLIGPGERYVIPEAIRWLQKPITKHITCIKEDVKIDFLHIDNAVQAHRKALEKLLASPYDPNVCGEFFYVTDDNPTNLKWIMEPLQKAYGVEPVFNILSVPSLVLLIATINEWLSRTLGKWITVPLFVVTVMEHKKMTISHYFCIDKARTHLGYAPKVDAKAYWTRNTAFKPPRSESTSDCSFVDRKMVLASICAGIALFSLLREIFVANS